MQMRGLAAIVANAGAVHELEESPEREAFKSEAEFESAYRLWWLRSNFWRASRTDVDS